MPQIRYIAVERRPRSLIAQIAAFLLGVAVLVASVVLGAFVLAGLLGFALIVGVVFFARLWWLRRQMARAGGGEDIIETEYSVIETRDRDSGRR